MDLVLSCGFNVATLTVGDNLGCHDIQHDDIQHNDTQNNGLNGDTQHKRHSA
jgi:hypothetical protein